ncbi:hypothetical protein ARMSODRAFT_1028444 [Armillaria solidipes]|uniref:Uncharacterized protein n=1 Tax=Armillaria solidipes TaxID=1076256 RepID=A0A2H3AN51_9AGAR|nr:hypothetical protein ARMSODRAFT_1028444 [Armillaria solidipes]
MFSASVKELSACLKGASAYVKESSASTHGMLCRTAAVISAAGPASKEKHRASGGWAGVKLPFTDSPQIPTKPTLSIMPPSTPPDPTGPTSVRPDGPHFPQQPHVQLRTHFPTNSRPLNPGRDKPLPPLPHVQRALDVHTSLQRQRDAIHPSFQPTPYTVETKTRHFPRGKNPYTNHHTPAQRRELSSNRRSLPPPYSALDPAAPPRSSRAIHFVHRLIDNPNKRRGNVGHSTSVSGPYYPLDTSPNRSPLASHHDQAPGGRVRNFFQRWREWLRVQATRNT